MSKIIFIAPNEEIMRMGQSLLPELGVSGEEVDVRLALMNQAVNVAKLLEREGADVIITRGGTSFLIQKEGLGTPVVEIPITGQDLAISIYEAKKLVERKNPIIGVIGFENMIKDIKVFTNILDVNMKIYVIYSQEEIETTVLKAKEDGVDVILGGVFTAKYAKKHGLPSVVLKCRENSMREAFKVAKGVAYARKIEKEKSMEMKTLIDYSFEAIIGLNEKGVISVFNPAAERIFNIQSLNVIGSNIKESIKTIDDKLIDAVLHEGKEIHSIIIKAEDAALVSNFTPIKVEGKVTGAMLSFQEIEKIEQIEAKIRKEIYLKGHTAKYIFDDILGESDQIIETKRIAEQFAKHDATVLIVGETGTGKELFAQSIHNESLRSNNPFVTVNCAALPSNLLESELFGYVEGAFTGAARKGKRGLFDIAHTGTIFLDEISEMDMYGQAKLLRVIQERRIMRLGDDKITPIDVRIIAATNKNLMDLVREGKFREDLYYRLNVLTLNIPPLRERGKDILLLMDYYINSYGKKFMKYIELTESAKHAVMEYKWQGNVRQLKNFCERLMATAYENVLDVDFVKMQLENKYLIQNIQVNKVKEEDEILHPVLDVSAEEIIKLMDEYQGNRNKVAEVLNISRTTLWRKIKQYNIKNKYGK